MLTIENINQKDILEMRNYQQPAPNYTRITLIRGHKFFARCVQLKLQEWISGDTFENVMRRFNEAIAFEVNLGSNLL